MSATGTLVLSRPDETRIREAPRLWRRFARNRLAVVALIILGGLALLAAAGPLVVASPTEQNVRVRLQGPSRDHWFGTDEVGRDIFARVVNGARISIASGLASVLIGLSGGTILGLIAGYREGRIGLGVMALVDLLLALPAILLAITIAARLGPGLISAMLAAGFVGLPGYARMARASTLTIKRREFVEAARATGLSGAAIVRRHVFPNILTPLIVQSTIGVGNAILLVSALGYLGLGAQPPTPEWGQMLSDAQRYMLNATYIGIFPGLAIAITVIGFNLAGDGLRDALDPVASR
ncbi:MAG: peptide/nickel transport system permease protein [Thermomicrobiales bacterium]|jgi:peptide/nickel transport system permease protein|nr:peptide/nickel transport system permease protein [Thermomicrobiales bacterium]